MKTILALGGGGFSMEPDNPLLDDYLLSLSSQRRPKICFISTAGGDNEEYVQRFFACFARKTCVPTNLSLFNLQTDDIAGLLLDQDILFVGGGSTRNLMILWKAWQIDSVLYTAYEQGIVLAGISAGANCWFEYGFSEQITNPAIAVEKRLTAVPGLGLLPGSFCPHFDGESYRQDVFTKWIAEANIPAGWAADDGVALHFQDGFLLKAVSSGPTAKAYFLERSERTRIEPEFLGRMP